MRRVTIRLLAAILLGGIALAPTAAHAAGTGDPAAATHVVAADGGDGLSRIAETDAVAVAATADHRSSSVPSAGGDAAEAEPDPEAEGGRLAFVLIPLLAAGVVVVGAIFVISRGRRGRRGD